MSCHGLRDKVEVWEEPKYPYAQNGRAFWLRYYGKNEDIGQAQIMSASVTPLGGDHLNFYANTTLPYGKNLFYEPIPFEWLRTYEEQPQVEVYVNGTAAVCHHLNCGYAYVEPVGEVQSFLYEDDTRKLNISGTNLPQSSEGVRYIEFAKTRCELDEDAFYAYTET